MRALSKKTVGTMLAIIMMLMGTLSVHAATYTWEYGSGTYTATLQFTSSYTVVALSYSSESPSDTQYTSVDGYIEYVRKYVQKIIFKNQYTIISIDKIDLNNLDTYKLDLVLHRFIGVLDYKALYLFTSYWELPDIGIKWNEWVLYSIILKYSKQFDVVTTSKIMKIAIPVIVKKGFKLSESIINEIESRKIENNELDDFLDFDEFNIEEF